MTAPPRRRGLRPASELPPRAKLFLAVAGLGIVAFAAWVSVRLWQDDSHPLAVLLIVLSCVGAIAIGIAVITLTRIAYSLEALPYLLGRAFRRLFSGR